MATVARSDRSDRSARERKSLIENIPLYQSVRGTELTDAYGISAHATWVKPRFSDDECLIDYEPLKLSSFRVCCVGKGTIMAQPVLLMEQVIIVLLFFLCAAPVYIFFKADLDSGANAVSVATFVREQEPKMREFAQIVTGLVIFLLSFYTSIMVARWWTMRTTGVGGIKAATVDLHLMLYQSVTQDWKILSAVRRYSRTSLLLIFLWRRKELAQVKETLMHHKLLDEHEAEQLVKWNKHCLHETIWAWQMAIVNKLYGEGKIKSDGLYRLLLQKCTEGRQAVQTIHTHLAMRVPMQYVHLLGLLVKMHNFVLAVVLGLLFGATCRNNQWVLSCQLFVRIWILPFLFNAILLINCDLSDPFDGSEADFPGDIYQENLEKDCVGMIGATDNVPSWFQTTV